MADLAATADVEAALGVESLTTDQAAKAPALLSEASDLVVGFLGCDPTDETATPTVPEAVTRVVARMVARTLEQTGVVVTGAEGLTEAVGPFSRTTRYGAGTTSGAPWIAASDKVALRPYRCGGGMVPVALQSAQTGGYRRYT
ncbi:hypothetical protein [Agromyces sp. SYSU T00194]|uniref:hypothetical protein n=1 Tax=Agromyces chitinivorans TaxID=3158560 RepID=UPI003394DD12